MKQTFTDWWCPFCFSLLILSLTMVSFCQAQVSIQVSPAKLYFTAKGHSEQTLRLHLTNPMNAPLVLQTSCADWQRDSLGDKIYAPAGSLPTTCCSLFKVSPSVIELGPGEKKDVLVTLVANVPATKPAGQIRNGMLFLTQSNEQQVARLTGAQQFVVKAQIGVHVYVLPEEGLQPDVAITAMNLVKTGDQYQISVQVQNTGGTLLESTLRLEYLNTETMEELKTEAVPVNTMPKDAFKVVSVVPPSLHKGKHTIVAILDSGPSLALKVAELEITLK